MLAPSREQGIPHCAIRLKEKAFQWDQPWMLFYPSTCLEIVSKGLKWEQVSSLHFEV